MFYISSWTIDTEGLSATLAEALSKGKIKSDDVVWAGPSGDAVIAATAADLDDEEEYADYIDNGLVKEYLNS